MLALLLAVLLAGALAAPTLTPAEAEALAAGEIVLRDLAPSRPGAVRVEAVADVRAAREPVWAALVDFEGRKEGNRSLKEVAPYRPATPEAQWIRWTVSAFGARVTYHNRYAFAPDRSWLTHELDPERENDLAWSRGRFTLADVPGGTRVVYDVESDIGRAVPAVVQRWLSSSAVEDFMADIVRRAEGR